MRQGIIEAYGLRLVVPVGWNAEIFRLGDSSPTGRFSRNMTPEELASSPPLLHAATVDLPLDRGTYATQVIDRLYPGDAFVVLIDHGAEHSRDPVFWMPNVPWPFVPTSFDASVTPYMKNGVVFVQRFFNRQGRAFVLFAGIHEGNSRIATVIRVNTLLAGLEIQQR